jgi:integrase
MPIYPKNRKKETLRRRVTVWAHGRQHEEIVHGTWSEADEHERRMRAELGARGRLKERIAPRFSDFCRETYAPFAVTHLGMATWRKVRRYQVATLAEFFGGYRLTEMTNEIVDDYKRARLREVRPSSVNNELRVFKTMLKWAADERDLPVPTLKIRRLKVPAPRVKVWSSADVGKLFASAASLDPELVPMLEFLLNTGCRKGEAIAAEWVWMDSGGRTLSIPSTEFWRPKNGLPREVPIGDALLATLRGLARRSDRWLFPNAHGERFAEFPNKRFAAVVKAAKLRGSPHTCRHTFASHFLAVVPDLHQLAEILGHSQTRVTELYTHLLPGHLDRARNAVNLSATPKTLAQTLADAV